MSLLCVRAQWSGVLLGFYIEAFCAPLHALNLTIHSFQYALLVMLLFFKWHSLDPLKLSICVNLNVMLVQALIQYSLSFDVPNH